MGLRGCEIFTYQNISCRRGEAIDRSIDRSGRKNISQQVVTSTTGEDDDASALGTNRIREQYLAAQTPRESWRRMSVMRRPREKRACPPGAAT